MEIDAAVHENITGITPNFKVYHGVHFYQRSYPVSPLLDTGQPLCEQCISMEACTAKAVFPPLTETKEVFQLIPWP